MIRLSKEEITTLMEMFQELGEQAITFNHYDLAGNTNERNPEVWKAFLLDPEIATWIKTEMRIVQEAEVKKMVKGAAKKNSVGQAQLMNALTKLQSETTSKDGPIFIYSYVPLNAQEEQAPNTRAEKLDIFAGML